MDGNNLDASEEEEESAPVACEGAGAPLTSLTSWHIPSDNMVAGSSYVGMKHDVRSTITPGMKFVL